jgi:signal transduction histidine kinase
MAARPVRSTGLQGLAQLEAQLSQLTEANHALRRFVAEAAHEMTAPLVIAEGSATLVQRELGDDLDPFLRARLDSLVSVAVRGRLLVESLLQEARSADRAPELANVEMGDVVDEALVLVAPSVSQRGSRVSVQTMPTLVTNRELVSIVIRNLVVNAVKYGAPRSEVRIVAERGPECWCISVISAGAPITPRDAGRILRSFERGTERNDGDGGVGLGLAICVRLVERLGGTMGLVPERGTGNRFFVVLPDHEPRRS